MATVTRTIASSGADYTTITLWEADLDNASVYSASDDAVGTVANESFDESVTINGGTTIGLNSIRLTVLEANRHDGTAGTGARIEMSTSGEPITINNPNLATEVEWLELDGNDNSSMSHAYAIAGGAQTVQHTARYIIAHNITSSGHVAAFDLNPGGNGGTMEIIRCFAYQIESTSTAGNRFAKIFEIDRSSTTTTVCNNTGYRLIKGGTAGGCQIFRTVESATHTYQNNIGFDPSGGATPVVWSDSDITTSTSENNGSSDATASGTNPQTNLVLATELVSTVAGSEDLHLNMNAVSRDNGLDLVTTPTGVNTDIDGLDINADPSNDPWDMGADEFVSVLDITGRGMQGLILTKVLDI